MAKNTILIFVAVMNLLIFAFVAAQVYNMEGTLGGEEDEVKEDGVPDEKDVDMDNDSSKYYIQIGDIKGEATAKGHKEWIEVLSYSHGISSPDVPLNPNAGTSKPFSIFKKVDESSPLLMKSMRDGDQNPVILHALRYNESSGEHDDHYYTIKLFGARIVTINNEPELGLSSYGASAPPTEEVTFVFGKIDWTYEDTGVTYSEDWQDGQGGGGPDEGPRTAIYLKIDGKNGTDGGTRSEVGPEIREGKKHEGWIDIFSVSQGIQATRPTLGIEYPDRDLIEYPDRDLLETGIEYPDRDLYQPLSITPSMDQAYPELMKAFANREIISGTIEFVRYDPVKSNDGEIFQRIRFSETTIASIDMGNDWSISGDADDRPTEEITFHWGRLEIDWVDAGVTHTMDRADTIEQPSLQEQAIFADLNGFFDVFTEITHDDRWDWRNNPVYSYEHEIEQEINAASGLPTGKRQHRPVEIIRRVDKSSPLLFKAMVDGITFDLTFQFMMRNPQPGNSTMMISKTISLTNASVVSVLDLDDHPDLIGTSDMEKVAFAYESITWDDKASGVTAEDDWESPVV